jgi:hypothetical protein
MERRGSRKSETERVACGERGIPLEPGDVAVHDDNLDHIGSDPGLDDAERIMPGVTVTGGAKG